MAIPQEHKKVVNLMGHVLWALFFGAGLFFCFLHWNTEDLIGYVSGSEGTRISRQYLGAALLCITGLGLFLLRHFRRLEYGILEVIFAAVTGFFVIGRALDTRQPTDLIGIVACVYLVVRGCDNVMEGLKSRESESTEIV